MARTSAIAILSITSLGLVREEALAADSDAPLATLGFGVGVPGGNKNEINGLGRIAKSAMLRLGHAKRLVFGKYSGWPNNRLVRLAVLGTGLCLWRHIARTVDMEHRIRPMPTAYLNELKICAVSNANVRV